MRALINMYTEVVRQIPDYGTWRLLVNPLEGFPFRPASPRLGRHDRVYVKFRDTKGSGISPFQTMKSVLFCVLKIQGVHNFLF